MTTFFKDISLTDLWARTTTLSCADRTAAETLNRKRTILRFFDSHVTGSANDIEHFPPDGKLTFGVTNGKLPNGAPRWLANINVIYQPEVARDEGISRADIEDSVKMVVATHGRAKSRSGLSELPRERRKQHHHRYQ